MSCDVSCKTTTGIVISIITSIIEVSTNVQERLVPDINIACLSAHILIYSNSFLMCGPFWSMRRISFLHMSCDIWRRGGDSFEKKGRVEALAWHMLHFRWWGLRRMNRRGVTLPTLLQIQGHVCFKQLSDIPDGSSF